MDPEEVENREFLITLRGYSRDEVDAFKAEVAGYLRNLTAELEESAGELRRVKAQLAEALERVRPGAEGVDASRGEAPPDRELAFKQVAQETERILMAAEQVAEQMHARARRESAEILTDARRQAQHGFDQVEEAKRRAERDLDSIRESRTLIASQMEDIRRRIDETINRLRIPVESPVTAIRPRGYREERGRAGQLSGPPSSLPPSEPAGAERQAEVAERDRRLKEIAQRQARELAVGQAAQNGTPATPEEGEASTAEEPEAPPAISDSDGSGVRSEAETRREQGEESARGALDELLEEFRRKRIQAPAADRHSPSEPEPADEGSAAAVQERVAEEVPAEPDYSEELDRRTDALGDLPSQTARRLKRLLQEEHNDILDRLRTTKVKDDAEKIAPARGDQLSRFTEGLGPALGEAFNQGRSAAGGEADEDVSANVERLVNRQVVKPLRQEVVEAIQAGLDAEDAVSSVAERASDVFRVWKGVRTALLGEGIAYAAYHQGLVEEWSKQTGVRKVWVLSEEDECPGDLCAANAREGAVDLGAAFPSGHLLPPAHAGCLCAVAKVAEDEND